MTGVEEHRSGAGSLVRLARDLEERADYEAALRTLELVIARFGAVDDAVVVQCVAAALWRQARVYGTLGMQEPRMSTLAQLVDRFGSATDPLEANFVTRAICFRALDRQQAGEFEEAEALFDETVRRARGASDWRVRDAATHAAIQKAWLLANRGLRAEALALLDETFHELADLADEHPSFLSNVLIMKLNVLELMQDDNGALRVADELIERFEDSTEHEQRFSVASALVQKLDSLARLGRGAEEGEAVLEFLADSYGEEGLEVVDYKISIVDPERDPLWERKLGPYLFLRATLLHELGRVDESADAFSTLIDQLADTADEAVAGVVQLARGELADLNPE